MPAPSPRNTIRPARGNYADLAASVASILDGEICYAIDQDQYYQNEGGVLVPVGATKAQGALADTALQPGEAATPAQGVLADSAIQPGDNVSELTNDAGYITSAGAPGTDLSYDAATRVLASSTGTDATLPEVIASGNSGLITGADKAKLDNIESGATGDQTASEIKIAYESNADTNAFTDAEQTKLANIEAGAQVNTVNSVAGKTGDVTLVKGDVGLGNVDNTSDAAKPISTATQTALEAKADLVNGVVPSSQIPAIAIAEFLGEVANETEMLALDGQKGDWCIRTDESSTYIVTGDDPTQLADWTEIASPESPVSSVNGQVGAVVLGAGDVGAATAAQGVTADSAVQPGDNVSVLTNDAGYITSAAIPTTSTLQEVTDAGDTTTNGATFGGDVAVARLFSGGIQASTEVENTFQYRAVYDGTCNFTVTNRAAYFGGTQAFSGAGSNAQINADGGAKFGGRVETGSIDVGSPVHDAVAGINTSSFRRSHSGLNLDCLIQLPLATDSNSPTGQSIIKASNNGTNVFNVGTDGSANFAGGALTIFGQGSIKATSVEAVDTIFIKTPGTSDVAASLSNDGSATFAGTVNATSGGGRVVEINGDPDLTDVNVGNLHLYCPTTDASQQVFRVFSDIGGVGRGKVDLKADGSADFAGTVEARQGLKVEYLTGDSEAFRVQTQGVEKVSIKADGKAEFAGDINAAKVDGSTYNFSTSALGDSFMVYPSGSNFNLQGSISTRFNNFFASPDELTSDSDRWAGSTYINAIDNSTKRQTAFLVKAGVSTGAVPTANETTAAIYPDGTAAFKTQVTVGNPTFFAPNSGFFVVDDPDRADGSGCGVLLFNQATGTDRQTVGIYGPGVNQIKIRLNNDGTALFTGNITAGNVSDVKFKENITDANPQLADVTALGSSLRNWDWKEEAPLNEELKSKRFLGLIAQEAEQICPDVTYEVTTAEDSYKAINHDILVMKLLGAVAELTARVEELEANNGL